MVRSIDTESIGAYCLCFAIEFAGMSMKRESNRGNKERSRCGQARTRKSRNNLQVEAETHQNSHFGLSDKELKSSIRTLSTPFFDTLYSPHSLALEENLTVEVETWNWQL